MLYVLVPSLFALVTILAFFYSLTKPRSFLYDTLRKGRWTLYGILLTLMIFSYFLIATKIAKWEGQLNENWGWNKFFVRLIDHFDTTGLTIGLVGIIIGLITVYYVERQNKSKDEDVQAALEALKKATRDINANQTHLNQLTTISSVFKRARRLVKRARDNSSELYTYTHLANFGQFFMRNAKVLLNEHSADIDLKNCGSMHFYKDYIEHFIKSKKQLNNEILSFAEKNRLYSAVLANPHIAPEKINRLLPFMKERMLKGKRVIVIDETKNEKIDFGSDNLESIYIHRPTGNTDLNKKLTNEDILVRDILYYDERFIGELKSVSELFGNHVTIEALDYIPFQFFVSCPENDDIDTGWESIVIFTNYYNLGYDTSIVSFHSENPTLCKGLKRMWNKSIEAQKKKDTQLTPVKKLFDSPQEFVIALKNIEIGNVAASLNIGFDCVTPVPDILGKDTLLNIFKEYDIKHNTSALYLKKSDIHSELAAVARSEKNAICFSLGLFYTPLTEHLSNLYPSLDNPFFKLISRKPNNSGKNSILISFGGTTTQPQFIEFEEVFSEEEESYDIGIVCRLTLNGTPLFVGGGINYYGSQHLATCLKSESTHFADKIVNKKFLALYKITKGKNSAIPTVLMISYLEGETIKSEQFQDVNSYSTSKNKVEGSGHQNLFGEFV